MGGGRLSGKVGRNTNIGFLNMQTASVSANGTPGRNFTVARVRQDLANRSNIGAIVVNRNATGRLGGDGDYNRTYAFDGRWGIGEGGTISGFAAATDTPVGVMLKLSLRRRRQFRLVAAMTRTSTGTGLGSPTGWTSCESRNRSSFG